MDCGDTTMMYKELVKALITKRKKFRVDTMTVSQMVGVADSLVGDWERGKKFPSATNLFAWCNALEVDLVIRNYETECPPDFEATPASIEWCQQEELNYDEEKRKFTNYYISKGRTSHNWESMFKLWIQRAIEFRRERKSNNSYMDKTSPPYVRERRERFANMSDVLRYLPPRKSKDK